MSKEVGNKSFTGTSVRSLPRPAGRVAIWAAIALLLARGLGAVLAPTSASAPAQRDANVPDPASAALAIRFARAYLGSSTQGELASFLAEGARVRAASPGAQVTQAEVAATHELGGGQEILTVACDLRDGRSLYLAVPISRSGAGEAAVSGAPWVVAAPSTAGVAGERPRPLAGPEAGAIRALAAKFLPAYLAARSAGELSYLLAPGASVAPLGGAVEPLGSTGAVSQVGDGEGPRRTVIASGRFRDPASGVVYRLAYRLALVKRNRWYVQAVEGALP